MARPNFAVLLGLVVVPIVAAAVLPGASTARPAQLGKVRADPAHSRAQQICQQLRQVWQKASPHPAVAPALPAGAAAPLVTVPVSVSVGLLLD